MKDFIYQTNKNDCGFASIKILLTFIYKDENFLYIPPIKKENEQYTLLDLKEFAKKYGVILGGYLISDISSLPNDKKPFIIAKKLENGNKHAIVIKRKYKYFSSVYDPDKGKYMISNKKLYKDISDKYEMLVVESFNKTIDLNYTTELVNKKDRYFLLFLEGSAVLCYFISAYFIKPNKHFLYPILLAIVGVLFAMIYKICTLNLMKKFDEKYIELTFSNNKKEREKNYRLLHDCKKGLFSNVYQIVLYIASAIAVNAILIIENPYSAYIILFSSIIALIEAFIILPKLKKETDEIDIEEKKMLDNDLLKNNEYLDAFDSLKEKTYKVAKKYGMKRILIMFILLIITILMSGIHEQANVYYVLFYFTFSAFTYTNFANAFTIADKNKFNCINEIKFLNLINKEENKNKEINPK